MIHNEKCDNCLCRTVCYFTFPGHELTEEDGECGHYICKKDIINPKIIEFSDEIIEYITLKLGKTQNILSNEIIWFIQNLEEKKIRKEW